MSMLILDTSVMIELLRGRATAHDFIATSRGSAKMTAHPVVEAELIAGARNRLEMRSVERLLARFDSVDIDRVDVRTSLRLLARHRLASGASWNDCLLSATAMRVGATVVTMNDKHFRDIEGLAVLRPF